MTERQLIKISRLVTIIQDVGSGKTHLALHIRGSKEVSDRCVISYMDLSQIAPRSMNAVYCSMMNGFAAEDISLLRRALVNFLIEKLTIMSKMQRKFSNTASLISCQVRH